MKEKGIAIVGRMAKDVQLLDGQTIKTNLLLTELRRCYPTHEYICVDTYQYKKHILPILINTVRAFIKCEHIFVLLSRNGRTFFFPILTTLNKFFHRRLYHDVIGGALPDEAAKSVSLQRQLKQFEINWVETEQMKLKLEKLGITNVEILPNFKRLDILRKEDIKRYQKNPFVFSMFSRVIKEKGIEVAAKAIDETNKYFGRKQAVLHIYGPVEDHYKEEFEQLLSQYGHCVSYMGCIPQEDSVGALEDSYMLLFPTYYKGEGIPGTIIDAYSSGLPVIASDWHFNKDLVHNNLTGYCYSWKKPELLTKYIIYAIQHPNEIHDMRFRCIKEASKYTPDNAMKQICQRMKL